MGRQVRFQLALNDWAHLEFDIRSRDAVFVAYYLDAPEVREIPSLDPRVVEHFVGACWLVRVQDIPSVRFMQVGASWLVDDANSPVIEVSWAPTSDGTHVEGRLFYQTYRWNRDTGERSPHDKGFLRWAAAILALVRHRFLYNSSRMRYESAR